MSGFQPTRVRIYRPYPDEIPWELLLLADPSEARVAGYADADFMRVAKHGGEPVGAYVLEALESTRYALRNLAVAPAYRHKGLGAWLLGHAIGLAESKGAREIFVAGTPLRGLFVKTGFAASGEDLLLTLTPE